MSIPLGSRITRQMIEEYTAKGYWGNLMPADYLSLQAREQPERTAIVGGGKRVTYLELESQAHRLAAGFSGLGISSGDIVGIQTPNRPEFIFSYFALSLLGAISMPFPITFRETELRHALSFTGASGLIVPDAFHDFDHLALAMKLRNELATLKQIMVIGQRVGEGVHSFASLAGGSGNAPFASGAPDANQVNLLVLTSGTTGTPKIVMHTTSTTMAMGIQQATYEQVTSEDRVLILPPLSTGFGIFNSMGVLAKGATLVLLERFNPKEVAALVQSERVTHLAAVPTALIRILQLPDLDKYDFTSVKVVTTGGAYVPCEVAQDVEQRLGGRIQIMYGASDVGAAAWLRVDDPPEKRYHTVGCAAPGMQLKLVDDRGNEVGPHEVGEVLTRGPITTAGYYGDPSATAEVFDADGWGHMGDLGILDDEGYLRIVGRKKDIIIRGGFKISAEEIEDLLHTHPKVAEAAVVAMPDVDLGERTCAFVIPRAGESITLGEIVAFLKGRGLATFKLPERLEVVGDFPFSAGGKVQKNVLRERLVQKLKEEARQG